MTITAIILNYRKYTETKECLQSLLAQSLSKDDIIKIILVDNGSNDDSTHKLMRDFPKCQYIFNENNLGFSKGVNEAIKLNLEQSDYFLLVNNDALLDHNCVQELLNTSQQRFISGPVIFYKNRPRVVWQGGGRFSKFRMNLIVQDKNNHTTSDTTERVDFVSGCIMLVPKKVFIENGYFDERFFFYGEDLDFCLRAKQKNIPVYYNRKAKGWHDIGNTRETRTTPFTLENLGFSYIFIIKKHYPKLKIYGLFLFLFIYTPFRLIQLWQGGNNLGNLKFWLKGGIRAWKIKI